MKPLLVGLLLGLAVGYWQGFGDGKSGRDNVAVRALNAFGVSKVKAAEEAREKRVEDAATP
ncbi:MAG TPA: hypothetical protein VJU87_12030 [Gemmatimonadaceae bacterium]|nr:hypothetical protein [Gemmatimonadaceae bacterium]